MPTSRPAPHPGTFAGQALALAWGAWTELGVSGWATSHRDWAVDPEPLILFTAWLGDSDPRLRDEATDWCVQNWRFVSKTRLRNLLHRQPEGVQRPFGEFAATVGAHAGTTWPAATKPRPYAATGRSELPPLERPSLVWLRVRAMFGLGARAEILSFFLSRSASPVGVARLADSTGYTKRNIAEECDTLQRAGVLSRRSVGNRFYYQLERRSQLAAFVGELPGVRPSWTAVLNITRELVTLELNASTASRRTLPVKVRQTFQRIERDLGDLDLEWPSDDLRGEQLWPAAQALGSNLLAPWSTGAWPGEPHPSAQGVDQA